MATIPGDGVGPEVVAAARRVVDAAGDRFGFTVDWSEHVGRRRRDRHVRRRHPRRGPRGLRRGGCHPPRRGRWPEVVRSGCRGPPRAGALRAARRAGPLREPASGHGPADARGVLAAAPRAPRRGRHGHRPRADRRDLLRGPDGGVGRAGCSHGARHAPLRRARDRADRSPRVRARAEPARLGHVGRQGQRARDLAPVAARRRRGRGRLPRRPAHAPARRFVRDAAHPPAGRLRRDRHREPVRGHPVGRGVGACREPRPVAVRLARGAADRARPVRPLRADPRLRPGHRRSRHREPDRHDPLGGDAAADVARTAGCRGCDRGRGGARARRRLADRRPGRSDRSHRWTRRGRHDRRSPLRCSRRSRRAPGSRHERRPGRPLRHDPARRDAGREHHVVARRQAARGADARRVRDAVHRGRLAGVEPEGHRLLRSGPQDALGAREARGVRLDPASVEQARRRSRTCASWSPPRRRS